MLKHIPFYLSLMGLNMGDGKESKQSHVLVYGAIEAHSFGEKGCIASNDLIAREVGLSEERTRHVIGELDKAGWVKVHLNGLRQRTLIEPLARVAIGDQPVGYTQPGGLATDSHIDYSKENTVEKDNTIVLSKAKPESPDVLEAKNYWTATLRFKLKETDAERRVIKSLIKEHGLEKVKAYITVVGAARGAQYCPVITSFKQLESKWYNLEAYGMRQQSEQLKRSVTITE